MRLYLCGFMGVGKTKVGRLVAEARSIPFRDLDCEVEAAAGISVARIFAEQGEQAFRDLEHGCLLETAQEEHLVVALGGGTFTFERNRALIAALGCSVWLDVPFALIAARLTPEKRQKRPLFADEERARALYGERAASYGLADHRLRVENEAPAAEVAARILPLFRVEAGEVPRYL
jgi:shikimate kinase